MKLNETLEALEYINPAQLNYNEWVRVGQALHAEGLDVSIWESWSRNDSRYKNGECTRKWETFTAGKGVTVKTIYKLAIENGWTPPSNTDKYQWQPYKKMTKKSPTAYAAALTDDLPETEPEQKTELWKLPAEKQTELQICAMFGLNDIVTLHIDKSHIMRNTDAEKGITKYNPSGTNYYAAPACDVCEALDQGQNLAAECANEAGAWVRLNPTDGKGCKSNNVTAYRYALLESDDIPVQEQYELIKNLRLPIAALVYSGNKSLHAVVKIGAKNRAEYDSRVNMLHAICAHYGLAPDKACKDPCRGVRLAGYQRGNQKQLLIATNTGYSDYETWFEWIDSMRPKLLQTSDVFAELGNLPELAPELIEGLLRCGHKMIVQGGSKAGKSFALIELAIQLSNGGNWFGFKCSKGKVLYINMELDPRSRAHRFKDVVDAVRRYPEAGCLDAVDLRGVNISIDDLVEAIEDIAPQGKYSAIIIDPVYKIMEGDENSAGDVGKMCRRFDELTKQTGAAVIYCHHHSKGNQNAKTVTDRSSGSGVHGRDCDAIVDLMKIAPTEQALSFLRSELATEYKTAVLQKNGLYIPDGTEAANLDAIAAEHGLTSAVAEAEQKAIVQAADATPHLISYVCREFRTPKPIKAFFVYPLHRFVSDECLWVEDKQDNIVIGRPKGSTKVDLDAYFDDNEIDFGKWVPIKELSENFGVSQQTVKDAVDKTDNYTRKRGNVARLNEP